MNIGRNMRAHVADHRSLDRADVGHHRSGFELRPDLPGHCGAGAIGAQTITRSAPATAAASVSTTWSAMPSSAMRRRVAAERALAAISRTAPCVRAARAIDEPIRPTPISARRLKSGAGLVTASRRLGQKFAKRGNDEPVRLFGADGHAQRIRQLIGRGLPQNEPSCREKGVRILGGPAFGLAENESARNWRRSASL